MLNFLPKNAKMQILLDLIRTALSLTGTCLFRTALQTIIFLPLTLGESPSLVYVRALQKEHAVLLFAIDQRPSFHSGRTFSFISKSQSIDVVR